MEQQRVAAHWRGMWMGIARAACALALAAVAPLQAQVLPAPALDLKAAGAVYAIARAGDGTLYLGGDFIEVGGSARAYLARLNPDGTLDAAWNPGADAPVRALVLDGANLWVGGDFQQIGGEARPFLAKLAASTGVVDTGFSAGLDGSVQDLKLDATTLYFGGGFVTADGQLHRSLARLTTTTGAVDHTWTPALVGSPNTIAIAGGWAYAGGVDFSGAEPTGFLARYAASGAGAVDPVWLPAPDAGVNDLAVQGAHLYVAGLFEQIGAVARTGLVRIALASADGVPDLAWDPDADEGVLQVDADATHVYAAGFFAEIGGAQRRRMAKLAIADAMAVAGWDPDASPTFEINALLPTGDGGALIGGRLQRVGGALHTGIVRVLPAGTADPAFDPRVLIRGSAVMTAPISDGGYLVGGDFLYLGATPRPFVLRLNPDRTLDATWTLDVDGLVSFMREAVGTASPLVLGGEFERVDGAERTRIVRVALDSTPDFAWNPVITGNANSAIVNAMHIEGTQLFIGGSFDEVDGQDREAVAKLDLATGELDPTWSADADNFVYSLVGDGAGSLYLGGDFLEVDGVPRQRLAKVGTGGAGLVDPAWNPSASGAFVRRLLYDAVGGHVYVAGAFLSLNGNNAFRRLARVSATGTGALDTTWFPNPGNGTARGLALDAAGWLYFGGSFLSLGGNSSFRHLARTNVRTVPNGAPDASWKPSVASGDPFVGPIVYTVAPLASGGVLAGGFFAQVGGLPRPGLAAIGPDLDRIFSDGYE